MPKSPVKPHHEEETLHNRDKSFSFTQDVAGRLETRLKDRVRVLLLRLGRSQNWLAREVGISKGSMSKIINGEWQPTSQVKIRISQVLDCDSLVLFGDSGYWGEYASKIKYPKREVQIG